MLFLRKIDVFLKFGGSAMLTEGSAVPVRSDFTEGSAEPFGSVVHYLLVIHSVINKKKKILMSVKNMVLLY